MTITLEIGPNLAKAIEAMARCDHYSQHGGLGTAIDMAFGINFSTVVNAVKLGINKDVEIKIGE